MSSDSNTGSVPPAPSAGGPSEGEFILRPDITRRLDWSALFGNRNPVDLELGAGDGSFAIQYAARNRDRNLLAVERLLGRLRKIDRKARRNGLVNVRALRLEAAYVLRWMVPHGSLASLHVYFPDPWPKRRHWKRRLINTAFTELAATALLDGGIVYLRTDHPEYFAQMTEVFDGNATFERASAPAELLEVVTDFEADFNRAGTPTLQAAWRRRPRGTPPPPTPPAQG